MSNSRKLKRNTRLVRKHIWTNIKSSNKPENGHQFRNNTDITIIEKTTEEEDGDIFETFPIYLAIIIVFIYVFLCSITMCLWESWDYFTAFYFFFVSISTIGKLLQICQSTQFELKDLETKCQVNERSDR
jgi:hypothetical protein